MTSRTEQPQASPLLPYYIAAVAVVSAALGVTAWFSGRHPDPAPMLLLSAMGILSYNLREPEVTSRIGFSFMSIILLASGAILGPFGAWFVGLTSQLVERDRRVKWFHRAFNMAMTSIIGVAGAYAYVLLGGADDLAGVEGLASLTTDVGVPLMVADVVQCLTNAVLLSAVVTLSEGVPFTVFVRRVLVSSGVAYVGYGVIGFLFVLLWYPAKLGPFSALLVLAPLLAARWAFMQYGEELRSHERTIDTLLRALGTKEPSAVARSTRAAQVAEWVAEELGLGPRQIVTARYASTLYEIGHLGVPTRILRRMPSSLNEAERRILERHYVVGARMIEGIDFLEDARSGIRHQHERFDGAGRPDGLVGQDIPVAARIVAVASAVEHVLDGRPDVEEPLKILEIAGSLQADPGRFDPAVVAAALAALEKHDWPAMIPSGATP